MKVTGWSVASLVCLFSTLLVSTSFASTGSGCDTATGTQFNLQPALNAQPQNSESVDFLLNGAGTGVDLVVGAANESDPTGASRFVPPADQAPTQVLDAFYVHRSGTNCNADFEGTTSTTTINPKVVADPARKAFFLSAEVITSGAVELISRTTAATLLSTTACPDGTQLVTSAANATCWPVQGTAVFNANEDGDNVLLNSSLAVDPRTSGVGAGNVYVAGQIEDTSNNPATSNIQIIACANQSLSCGQAIVASGADVFATHPSVQVREDGLITISYWAFSKPFGTRPNPANVKFVSCKPQGVAVGPLCSKPVVVSSGNDTGFDPGDNDFGDALAPKHASRRESDGSFTTFLIYDRCNAIISPSFVATDPVCSKVDLLLTNSTNNGANWSTPTAVESVAAHQYFGNIRVDASTGITSIAYYSSQNDFLRQRSQIFLSQIPVGSTTVGQPNILTSAPTDPNVGIQDLGFGPGTGIGLAVAGTGKTGQSKVYVHFTSTNFFGISNKTRQPNPTNTLVPFSY
jgi:hypothetical protein